MGGGLPLLLSSSHAASELKQLLSVAALAVPALGIVVVDPLMGLVDTACIGRTSTEQLAALAPNSAVFNMMFQVRSCYRGWPSNTATAKHMRN